MARITATIKKLGHVLIIRLIMLPMYITLICSQAIHISTIVNRRFPGSRLAAIVSYHVAEATRRIDSATPRRIRVATLAHGAKLAVRADDWLWRTQLVTGLWEPETTNFTRRWLRNGDVFIDIGANNGYFSCLAAQIVGKQGIVHAFEPAPVPFGLLKSSVQVNRFEQTITCHRVAIGERHDEVLTLHLPADRRNNGQSSLVAHDWLEGGRQIEVPVWSLDGFLQSTPLHHVRLVKFDIEGSELSAIRGGMQFFRQVRPGAVICEVWAEDVSPGTAAEVIAEFQRFGYAPRRISPSGALVSFDGRLRPGATENLCFLPDDGC